jgi:hypothetical protein
MDGQRQGGGFLLTPNTKGVAMPTSSDISITYDGQDITRYVVFAQSQFELVAAATPGTATLVIRDRDRELSFIIGKEVILTVDGVRLWGGILMDIGRSHFFPVVDSSDLNNITSRQWTLTCTDYNIYFDKRAVRNTANYFEPIMYGPGKLGTLIRQLIPQYMDVPAGLDYTTFVEDTNYYVDQRSPLAPGQGKPWRETFEHWANLEAFTFYIDARKRLRFHAIENTVAPWGFTDHRPRGRMIGFREGTIREDGMQMVTDALVWGGKALKADEIEIEEPVFARYPSPPANTEVLEFLEGNVTLTKDEEQAAIDNQARFGRWQRAEKRVGEVGYYTLSGVKLRAHAIVAGDSGTSKLDNLDGGLGAPVWQVSLTWFAHDVPGKVHLEPGHIVDMIFYTLGESASKPLVLGLPLRSVSITFPTLPSVNPNAEPLTYVRFDGQFGISYADPRALWRFLRGRRSLPASGAGGVATVSNSSSSTVAGASGSFTPIEKPDGSRHTFTLPFSYLAGTTEVDINGLRQRPGYEYREIEPGTGKIEFFAAPHPDDTIYVTTRTGST